MNEDALEQSCLALLSSLGYQCAFGPEIAPGEPADCVVRLMSGEIRVKIEA